MHTDAQPVLDLFKQANDMANAIEIEALSEQDMLTHQKKLEVALKLHIENMTELVFLYEKNQISTYFDPIKTDFPLNNFLQETMQQKQQNKETLFSKITDLVIMPVQHLPKYKILIKELQEQLTQYKAKSTVDQVLMPAALAAEAVEKMNELVGVAAFEYAIECLKTVEKANKKCTLQDLDLAETALKKLICEGEPIAERLEKQAITLSHIVVTLHKLKKIAPVCLQAPLEKQMGDVAANVLSGYIKAGFPLSFNESIQASALWKKNLGKTPIMVNFTQGYLKNAAQVYQAVATVNQLREQGLVVQTNEILNAAVQHYKNKKYSMFNFADKARQTTFSKLADKFLSAGANISIPVPAVRFTIEKIEQGVLPKGIKRAAEKHIQEAKEEISKGRNIEQVVEALELNIKLTQALLPPLAEDSQQEQAIVILNNMLAEAKKAFYPEPSKPFNVAKLDYF